MSSFVFCLKNHYTEPVFVYAIYSMFIVVYSSDFYFCVAILKDDLFSSFLF